MSGGHFSDNRYIYYMVDDFADQLDIHIQNNNQKDEWGHSYSLSDEALQYLKEQVAAIRKTAYIMKQIDYLYSGDLGEESFFKKIKEQNASD
jgi:hypothetical protein